MPATTDVCLLVSIGKRDRRFNKKSTHERESERARDTESPDRGDSEASCRWNPGRVPSVPRYRKVAADGDEKHPPLPARPPATHPT